MLTILIILTVLKILNRIFKNLQFYKANCLIQLNIISY